MNNQKFQNFIDLVTFDQGFSELEKKQSTIEKTISKMNDQLLTFQKQLEQNSSKKRDIKKQLDAQELQVKSLQEQEKHQAEISQAVSSAKEYEAANKELQNIIHERNSQEQKMLQHLNKLETAEKEYGATHHKAELEIAEINQSIEIEKSLLLDTQKQIDNLQKDRSEKLSLVPDEWLDLYENMRGRVKDPVVKVSQDSCGACFYLISSRDLQALQQHELLQCKDCYRFLYCEKK
jgi:predicted  nucleic acid-binding Zn-ribbon protein